MTDHAKPRSSASLRRFVFLAQWRFSELLAFSVIFLLGALILVIHLATWGVEARKEAKFLVATRCVVERAAVRPDPGDPKRFRPEVTVQYEIDGESYATTTYDRTTLTDDKGFSYDLVDAQTAIRPYYPGMATVCWVRADDPTKAVLVKRSNVWGWIFLIIPTLLILSGGILLCSRLYERVFSQEARASVRRTPNRYPTLPNVPPAESRPGVELSRRLDPDERPAVAFVLAALGAVAWNVASWAVFIYVLSVAKTRGDYVSAWIFFVVFCGLGLVFACRAWNRRKIEKIVGSTDLEISTLPILPGRKVKFCLFLRGRMRAKRLDVLLRCEEIARYVQGTNTVEHRYEAYGETLLTKYGLDVPARQVQLERFVASIPIGAAPSFQAEHNEIVWKIELRMEFGDGGTYRRDFKLVVYPFLPKED